MAKAKQKRPRATEEQIAKAGKMLRNTTKNVKQVAKELGISQNVIYYHFPGGKRRARELVQAKKPNGTPRSKASAEASGFKRSGPARTGQRKAA